MSHQESRSNRGAQVSVPKGSISKYLVANDISTENQIWYLRKLLADREEQQGAKDLDQDNASRFVELLDAVLRANKLDAKGRRPCVRYLARVCGWHDILPNSVQISNHRPVSVLHDSQLSKVSIGRYNNRKVIVKAINFYQSYTKEMKREITMAFCKEVVIWKHLDHPNVLPFIGAMMVTEPGRERYEVLSEFMGNGDIRTFTRQNPDVNRLKLLKDAAEGLSYLHSQSVVHGDLKGVNVLINDDRRACLADFGLTRILAEFTSSGPKEPGGTAVWMSPEMYLPENFNLKDGKPTKESDIYAFGILIYEVICGYRPYPELTLWGAAEKMQKESSPPRPNVGFTDSLWNTLKSCLQKQREMRPNAATVLGKLNEASRA